MKKLKTNTFLYSIMAASLVALSGNGFANPLTTIKEKSWIHGSENCDKNTDPAIDVLKVEEGTYILRQNKCVHYEAPFIYVLFGQHTVFIQDTGATADKKLFPLQKTINQLIANWENSGKGKNMKVIVSHSHSHSDHIAGDVQFKNSKNVTVIEPNSKAVKQFFKFDKSPNNESKIDLGGRTLKVFPIPGHQDDSVAVYDSKTQFLLTGDSFYPGRLYVRNWSEFSGSIQNIVNFSKKNTVTAYLGTHIEMSDQPGVDYPMGTKYQPKESSLELTLDDLLQLNQALIKIGASPKKEILNKVIIYPVD